MKITPDTRIKLLLDADRDKVIDALVKLNSNFSKLRNPVMRNLLARRITIAQACKIAGCSIGDFFDSMRSIGFEVGGTGSKPLDAWGNTINFGRQTFVHELDVRPLIAQDHDPLKEILDLAKKVGIGERMKIINSFEPIPLIHLLSDQGFLHYTDIVDEETVLTWFEKTTPQMVAVSKVFPVSEDTQTAVFEKVKCRFLPDKVKYLDVRALEMPQPMLQILSTIDRLQADELLCVYHKKIPTLLLPELNKRGLIYLIHQKSNTEVDLLIYRL